MVFLSKDVFPNFKSANHVHLFQDHHTLGSDEPEVFAFTLQSAGHNVGALISDVAVYVDQDGAGRTPSYNITLNAVDQSANPVNQGITGNFESNGV